MRLKIQNAKINGMNSLRNIYCEDGKIVEISEHIDREADITLDAGGNLVTEAMIDPHVHLDKVNVVDNARSNISGTLQEAIEILWDQKKNYTVEDIIARGEDVILRGIQNGVLFYRTHVDVDTVGGLMPLRGVLALREKYRDAVDIQIVAFPQEGIQKDPGCLELMDQAMQMGADVVGGMPANELSPEESLKHIQACFEIAQKYDADIDMHVDETDDPFYRTLEMLADETIKRGWQGRVTAGHTCALAAYDDHYASYVIEKVKRAGISVITNPATNLMLQGRNDRQPIRRGITRVKQLLDAGVNVSFGQDCVKDTFYAYGSEDMLQVANITAHAAQMGLPEETEELFRMITGNAAQILRLEHYGLQEGQDADIVVHSADQIRDLIRLAPPRRYVIRKGRIIAETKVETIFKMS